MRRHWIGGRTYIPSRARGGPSRGPSCVPPSRLPCPPPALCSHARRFLSAKAASKRRGRVANNARELESIGPRGGPVAAAAWLDSQLTLTATPKGRLTTGVHRLDVERDWLLYDPSEAESILNLKREMLDDPSTRPSVLQCDPDSLDAQEEVLEMVAKHASARYPESFRIETSRDKGGESSDVLLAIDTGEALPLVTSERKESLRSCPLEAVARLVQEDFVVMKDHVFHAGCVVSSFGRLAERFNLDLRDIHARVQGYDKDLHNPVTRFFDGLKPDRPCWRTNWALTWHPSLKPHPERYPHRSAFAEKSKQEDSTSFMLNRLEERGVGESIWLKVEYQTFRRLSRNSDCILFSIRTFVDPLTSLNGRPIAAKQLVKNINAIEPVEFRKYLGLDDDRVRTKIRLYLQDIAAM